MIVPLMIGDYRKGELDVKSLPFKVITGIASLLALSIPVIQFNPIKGQIFTQVLNTFGLPLVVFSFLFLWNRKDIKLPGHRLILNVIIAAALLFAVFVTINALSEIFY